VIEPEQEGSQAPSVRRVAGLLAANSSLLVAGLVYMGWAYTDALWGYFHVSPLNLGVGAVEYLLRSLNLFSPTVVIASALFVAVTSARAWNLDLTPKAQTDGVSHNVSDGHDEVAFSGLLVQRLLDRRRLITSVGLVVTAAGLTLFWAAGRVSINTYLLLALFAAGPLLLTRPSRAHRYGGVQYSLAIVVAAVCTLWAGSLYAHSKGVEAAQSLVRNLPEVTAVTVYSVHPLDLAGPKITSQDLGPKLYYRYEYGGLRLLTSRAGTYYLLPLGWTSREGITYVIPDNDDVRIDLYSAEVDAS
jgi:TRAP-type C4-dicarboxylate transport system permease small subunit